MKQNALKSLIKQAVKEAIQEELKDILLEAVRAPKQQVVESVQPQVKSEPALSAAQKREMFQGILGDMQSQYTTQNISQPFNPQGAMPGGDLPSGEVDMSQIMGLMNSK
jgi:hypothetical protein